jgi:hypothetical protein
MRAWWLIIAMLLPGTPLLAAQAEQQGLAERVARAAFSATERTLIEEYFGKQASEASTGGQEQGGNNGKEKGGKKMPHGLAKRDSLPPGLQRQLEKNGTLPPGLAKRDLPADLTTRLPARNDGTERVIVDSDVVLVEAATGVVLDILRGVVNSGN